jgi:hypothetical protein
MNGKTTLTMNLSATASPISAGDLHGWAHYGVSTIRFKLGLRKYRRYLPSEVCTNTKFIISNRDLMSVRALTYDVLCLGTC